MPQGLAKRPPYRSQIVEDQKRPDNNYENAVAEPLSQRLWGDGLVRAGYLSALSSGHAST